MKPRIVIDSNQVSANAFPRWRVVEIEDEGEQRLVLEVAKKSDAMGDPQWGELLTANNGRVFMHTIRHDVLDSLITTLAGLVDRSPPVENIAKQKTEREIIDAAKLLVELLNTNTPIPPTLLNILKDQVATLKAFDLSETKKK